MLSSIQTNHGISTLWRSTKRIFSTALPEMDKEKEQKYKTGILLLNMGGPKTILDVENYLRCIFSDRDIIKLPFQNFLGPLIAKNRTPKLAKQYSLIGGGSPIHKWTHIQGQGIISTLDVLSPATAPHKYFVGFRYTHPFIEDSLEEMEMWGVERAVALSMYPQYSCSTTGSSLNAIYTHYTKRREPSKIIWSTVDRWFNHSAFIDAYTESIKEELQKFPEDVSSNTVIIFSAHSLPMKNVNRGDAYPHEVAASVNSVMEKLGYSHPYAVAWQSRVKLGPLKWLGPRTEDVITGLTSSQYKGILLVPISFSSDHIETLYELDIELARLLPQHSEITIRRAGALNDRPTFIKGMAELLKYHLDSPRTCSHNLHMMCTSCPSGTCKKTKDFFKRSQVAMHLINEKLSFGSGYTEL